MIYLVVIIIVVGIAAFAECVLVAHAHTVIVDKHGLVISRQVNADLLAFVA